MRHPAVKYRTICPHCASVFRVGPEQLEAAGGWVQCGVCGAPFETWPTLLREDGSVLDFPVEPPPRPTPVTEPPVGAAAPAATSPPASTPDETRPTDSLATTQAAPVEVVGIARREHAEELTSIILVDPDQPADDDFGPFPVIATPPLPPAYPPVHRQTSVAEGSPDAGLVASEQQVTDTAAPADEAAPEAEDAPAPVAVPSHRQGSPTWLWAVASGLLLLTLAGQMTYFLRDILATEVPQTRPLLERACALLGCTLELPHQIEQLRIVGSDLQSEATERLRLTLTLGNRSGEPQAWPVLILTLTDPQGKPLARRSFAPSEYLGDPARIAAGIPPRSEHQLTLPLSVRNLNPMGFDLRLTY